ncbi:MAG: macro domain-containing protein [Chloroflexota bacterium]
MNASMKPPLREHLFPTGQRMQLVQGDLTLEKVDAIVNAANAHLQHGGGLAWVILRRAGPQIQVESDAWVRQHGPVTHDRPAYTRAGNLPCRYIIHAVGPVWGSGNEDSKLAIAVKGALRLADKLELSSLALPAISTGIFGFPKLLAAHVTLSAIREHFAETSPREFPDTGLRLLRLVLFDAPTLQAFLQAWEEEIAASNSLSAASQNAGHI